MTEQLTVTGRVTCLERQPKATGEWATLANSLLFRIENDADKRFFSLELADEISVRILLFAAHHGKPIRVTGRSMNEHVKQVTELSVDLLPSEK